eukprot:Pompholyxophrys_sp_v1_NODE_2_length_20472_cov_5.132586.p8 type:complete len:302 gc:universal NODE_2_length_20472_cov_5.132586:19547-18642(-)
MKLKSNRSSDSVECDGFTYLENILQQMFSLMRTFDGCLADCILRPKDSNEDEWLKIQLKVCSTLTNDVYPFTKINKGYLNCIIICLCLEDKNIWVFENKDVSHLSTISIGKGISKYNKNKILSIDYLYDILTQLYKSSTLYDKATCLIPITEKSQLEHEYRTRRESFLSPLVKFEYSNLGNDVYDFSINNKKYQEKVSLKQATSGKYVISLIKGDGKEDGIHKKTCYVKGDNDFYWIWIRDTTIFYIFPEDILIEKGYVDAKKRTKIIIDIQENDWKKLYKFQLDNLDKFKFKTLLKIDLL